MLPALTTSTYSLTVPSTKKKTKFRPFVAREEKILLVAKESKSEEQMIDAVREVIKVCTFGELLVDTMPSFDLEYIFLQLRARSVSETVSIKMECLNQVTNPNTEEFPGEQNSNTTTPCKNSMVFDINLLDIEVTIPEDHNRVVIIDDSRNIGVTFRYPVLSMAPTKNVDDINFPDNILPLVENIFDNENVYSSVDIPVSELREYFLSMTRLQLAHIKKTFFDTMPTVVYTHKYKCSKCGNEGAYTFRGIKDFF